MGDHTETGKGGICIYEGCSYFKDEFHDNIKFTNKGMVACANRNLPNTNNSQFFITIEKADYLNKKNTIFGEVESDSMFNVIKLNELETDTHERPFDTPKIITIKIIWNPFKDFFLYVIGEKNKLNVIIKKKNDKFYEHLSLNEADKHTKYFEKNISNRIRMKKMLHSPIIKKMFIDENHSRLNPFCSLSNSMKKMFFFERKKTTTYISEGFYDNRTRILKHIRNSLSKKKIDGILESHKADDKKTFKKIIN